MNNIARAIMLGAFSAGVLDLCYAFIVYGPLSYGLSPMRVLQSVAAGWVGRDASRAGGWSTAGLGLATHFMLATMMATVFVLAATRIRVLATNALPMGFAYGLILYIVMNYVVVPLSAAHASQQFAANIADAIERLRAAFSAPRPAEPLMLIGTIFTHTLLVGIPIALSARRYT